MKQHIDKALKLRKWVSIGHHIPGRVRLKYKLGIVAHLASFRNSEIEQAISSVPAFKNYKINVATGSIVIEYDANNIQSSTIDALFSDSEVEAEQACYSLAEQLKL
ncbi:cation transporter [Vibrio sp. SNU_ST1]|uniref:HMA2 domain-containing protein n=1 Tax=Vibrio sp. SNU_ST1 TaxID=3064001 RepID=UPI0027297BAF|nr:cation transporter [Vibrio sp. SNU_ST1]WKY60505.1 cation transporter [Vibrio sp. SNU_ST1]